MGGNLITLLVSRALSSALTDERACEMERQRNTQFFFLARRDPADTLLSSGRVLSRWIEKKDRREEMNVIRSADSSQQDEKLCGKCLVRGPRSPRIPYETQSALQKSQPKNSYCISLDFRRSEWASRNLFFDTENRQENASFEGQMITNS